MKKFALWTAVLGISAIGSSAANAQSMTLTSSDIKEGGTIANEQVFKGFGCTGSPFVELASSRGKSIRFTNNSSGADPAFDDFLFELVYARPDFLQSEGKRCAVSWAPSLPR